MGTRCLTVVKDGGLDSDEICVLYAQFDGYPSGHGEELRKLFGDYTLVNGIPVGAGMDNIANGMSCFAVQLITKLKLAQVKQHRRSQRVMRKSMERAHQEDPSKFPFYKPVPDDKHWAGNFYLYPAGTRDVGESYVYTIYLKEKEEDGEDSIGELQLRVETPEYTKDYKRTGSWRVLYDGALKDFDAEACKEED